MDDAYRKCYRELYFGHWWWRAREDILIETLRRSGVKAGGRVLDVGCGGGLLFPRLAEFGEVEGIEVDAASARGGAADYTIHVRPFDRTFRPARRYTLILILDVLEHLEDPKEPLAYSVELLEKSGVVLVTVPALNCLWTTHDDLNQHLRRYSKTSFARLAHEAGLKIRCSRYIFQWLAASKLLVRAKESFVPTVPKPPGDPSPAAEPYILPRLAVGGDALAAVADAFRKLVAGTRWKGSNTGCCISATPSTLRAVTL